MADLYIYFHKQTNSWWIDKKMDGFTLRNYISKNPIGLGRIEIDTNDKSKIKNLFEINSVFIPNHIKKLSDITEEIEKNGLNNGMEITYDELKKLLE